MTEQRMTGQRMTSQRNTSQIMTGQRMTGERTTRQRMTGQRMIFWQLKLYDKDKSHLIGDVLNLQYIMFYRKKCNNRDIGGRE